LQGKLCNIFVQATTRKENSRKNIKTNPVEEENQIDQPLTSEEVKLDNSVQIRENHHGLLPTSGEVKYNYYIQRYLIIL
jgi:hypothetical protein